MRIALITPGGVDRSGTHRVIPCLLWLIERLAGAGHEVHVFALHQEPEPGDWRLLGAEIHNAGRRPAAVTALRRLLALHRKVPFDLIHAFWAQPCGAIGAAASLRTGAPLVLTLPGGDAVRLQDIGYGGLTSLRGRWMLRVATARAAAVTVPSRAMADQVRALGIEVLTVPLGVATDRWPCRPPRPRIPGAPLRLIHAASLNRVKDQTMLLRAVAQLRDAGLAFALRIVGEDTLGGEVQAFARALDLDGHVRFEPFATHAQLHRCFAGADLLVMSSRHEAGPLVLLEAAIAGVPTVGTAVGHIADFAPDAALAVPAGDATALASAVLRLAEDDTLRLRLAEAAQARALAEDADHTARHFLRIYAALQRRSGAGDPPIANPRGGQQKPVP